MSVKMSNATLLTVLILFQPVFFFVFPMTVVINVSHRYFEMSNFILFLNEMFVKNVTKEWEFQKIQKVANVSYHMVICHIWRHFSDVRLYLHADNGRDTSSWTFYIDICISFIIEWPCRMLLGFSPRALVHNLEYSQSRMSHFEWNHI